MSDFATKSAEGGKEESDGSEIFVRNLSWEVTKQDLVKCFEAHGPVKRAVVVEQNGASRGFGFVKFAFVADATAALSALQGYKMFDRPLKLELSKTTKEDYSGNDRRAQVGAVPEDKREVASNTDKAITGNAEAAPSATDEGRTEDGAGASRSRMVILCGIPSQISKKTVKKVIVKHLRRVDTITRLKPDTDYDGTGQP